MPESSLSHHEDGSYSCAPGIELIAEVLAGKCKMEYTKAIAGDGYLTEEENPKDQTKVAGTEHTEATIASITNPVHGECQVSIQINSEDVDDGFFCTGILLYAKGPDEEDVPFTYLVMENNPEWIRPKTSSIGKLTTIDVVVAVGDVEKVYASLDPTALVTLGDLERHNTDPEAHLITDDKHAENHFRLGVEEGHLYIQLIDEGDG